MSERNIRFTSWAISITSILYGVISLNIALGPNFYGESLDEAYFHAYYIPLLLLVIFGISKIIGLIIKNNIVRRVSIVGLMFSWGFIWTASLINFITGMPNRMTIVLLPIIAICAYIATEGDYSDD